MRYIKKLTAVMLAASMLAASPLSVNAPKAAEMITNADRPIRAMLISTNKNRDFPYAPNQSSKQLKDQIQRIVSYNAQGGYNTLMLELRSEGEAMYSSKDFPRSQFHVKNQGDFSFFDPLKQFITAADKQALDLYAVINPFYLGSSLEGLDKNAQPVKNPQLCFTVGNRIYFSPFDQAAVDINVRDIAALVSKYDVKGIVLEGLDDAALTFQEGYAEAVRGFADKLSAAIKAQKPDIPLGISFDDSKLEPQLATEMLQSFDLILPVIKEKVAFTDSPYTQALEKYKEITSARLIPMADAVSANSPTMGDMLAEPNQLVFQQYANRQNGINDMAVKGYRSLKGGFWGLDSGLATFNASDSLPAVTLDYSPAQTLAVTYPKNNYRTNLSKFYVTGTSTPGVPLTLNGKEIEVSSNNGAFGVLVELNTGNNTLNFKQGSQTASLVIERYIPSATTQTIDKITSILPDNFTIAYSGEKFTLRCTAPAGSSVSASLAGQSYPLKQQSSTSAASVPATYTAEITLNAQSAEEFKDLGQVTYTLNHKGKTTTYTSTGRVYLLGSAAQPMVKVNTHTASIYFTDELVDGTYKSIYKQGTIEGFTVDNNYSVKLNSGGYIKKSVVDLVNPKDTTLPAITDITLSDGEQHQSFVLKGAAGVPFEFSYDDEGAITLNLLGSYDLSGITIPESGLFSEVSHTEVDGQTQLYLKPNNPQDIWGYDMFYQDSDALIYFKRAPAKSDNPFKPLQNLVVVLDPGHGGSDPGALGVLRTSGPNEKEINLAIAATIKGRLELLGATVYMTREDDSTMSLTERAIFTTDKLPHVSISTHHNSLAETTDANKARGVEGYYFYGISKDLSDTMLKYVTAATERNYRISLQANYIVTKYNYAKSMLLEIGYLPNAMEYERVVDDMEMFRTACGVSSALIELVNR